MKKLLLLTIPLMLLTGCATEWYENGQMKRQGAIQWSTGKVLSLSVIGK